MSDRHQQKPYPLRMPEGLRERLEAAAISAGRSLNAEIARRLDESFAAISADEIVARAEESDAIELIALQKMLTDAFTAQQAYLTSKIFDALDAQGALEKYKSDDSNSWLKLAPPAPDEEFSADQFSLEIARQKVTTTASGDSAAGKPKRRAR